MSSKQPENSSQNFDQLDPKQKFASFVSEAKAIIVNGLELGLIDPPKGDLIDVLNDLSVAASTVDNESNQAIIVKLFALKDMTDDRDVEDQIPFFGINVSLEEDGSVRFIYAD